MIITTSFRNELVAITIEELDLIWRGAKLAIMFCTLSLPIKLVEVLVVIVSTHVEGLEELVTLKLVPFIIPKIG